MQIPIIKQGDTLIVTVPEALSDKDLVLLSGTLADAVGKHRSRGVVLDVTVLDVLDSFAIRTLRSIAYTMKLRGSETVIVGIGPEVAYSMVQLGLTLEGVSTALDVEDGLILLRRLIQGMTPNAE